MGPKCSRQKASSWAILDGAGAIANAGISACAPPTDVEPPGGIESCPSTLSSGGRREGPTVLKVPHRGQKVSVKAIACRNITFR